MNTRERVMKILLIGSGYVGMRLLKHWEDPQDRFIVSTTSELKLPLLKSLIRVEKVLLDAIEEGLSICDGAIICVAPKEGATYEATYLETAKTVVQALEKRERPFYLLYTSSTSVYGQHTQEWIDETTPPHPTSDKAKILLETENTYLSCAREKVTVCIIRLAGIYGPQRDLPSRAKKMSGREIPGQPDQPTNHSHIEDIGRGIEFCFKHHLEGIYNLVSDAHPTRDTLYRNLCEKQGILPPTWNPHTPQHHGCNCKISSQKLKDKGFVFTYPSLDI